MVNSCCSFGLNISKHLQHIGTKIVRMNITILYSSAFAAKYYEQLCPQSTNAARQIEDRKSCANSASDRERERTKKLPSSIHLVYRFAYKQLTQQTPACPSQNEDVLP